MRTRGGGGSKNLNILWTSLMDAPNAKYYYHYFVVGFPVRLRSLHLPGSVRRSDRVLVAVLANETLVEEALDEGCLAAELLAQQHHFQVDAVHVGDKKITRPI